MTTDFSLSYQAYTQNKAAIYSWDSCHVAVHDVTIDVAVVIAGWLAKKNHKGKYIPPPPLSKKKKKKQTKENINACIT